MNTALETMLVKTAQSIFNRSNRTNASALAQTLVSDVIANWNQFALEYRISDEFELIEAIALDVVKELK